MKNILKISVVLFMTLLYSCAKELDDAAVNTNDPTDVQISSLMPAAIQSIAYTVGDHYHINSGIWAQYWTQGSTASQYVSNEQYNLSNSSQDRPWSQLYSGALKDLEIIKSKAMSSQDTQSYIIALILEAYSYQLLTDAYGDVPLSQALSSSNFNPAYDKATVVYDSIEKKLLTAQEMIENLSHEDAKVYDIVYNGNMTNWYRFTNTLLLRVYMRQVYSRPSVAAKGIANLPTGYFINTSTNAKVNYINAINQMNPFWMTMNALTFENLKASNTALSYMNSYSDPRIAKVYNKATATSLYTGFAQGAGKLPGASTANANYSGVGDAVGGINSGQAVPVILMSSWESLFLQAEAAARGLSSGSANTLYNSAIAASCTYFGLTTADATTIQTAKTLSGDVETQCKKIVTQKWLAMNGTQNFEAWTEIRRFSYGLDVTFPTSLVSNFGSGRMPYRFPIPASEISSNSSAPVGVPFDTKMWFSK